MAQVQDGADEAEKPEAPREPGKEQAHAAEAPAEEGEADDDDYDPFDEQPADHVAEGTTADIASLQELVATQSETAAPEVKMAVVDQEPVAEGSQAMEPSTVPAPPAKALPVKAPPTKAPPTKAPPPKGPPVKARPPPAKARPPWRNKSAVTAARPPPVKPRPPWRSKAATLAAQDAVGLPTAEIGKRALKMAAQTKAGNSAPVDSTHARAVQMGAQAKSGAPPAVMPMQPKAQQLMPTQAKAPVPVPSPWKSEQAESIASPPVYEVDSSPAVAAAAMEWLRRGPKVPRRVKDGAQRAEEYFVHAAKEEAPAAKKPRLLQAPQKHCFTQELLEKAPGLLQTCRSLLLFIEKKMATEGPPVPPAEGPTDLHARLQRHADSEGRLAGLRAPGGWDTRAKRVLDIAGVLATPDGKAAVEEAEARLRDEATALEAQLKERGDGALEALTCKRRARAQEQVRTEWLRWCSRLLHAKEVALLAEADGNGQAAKLGPAALGAREVLEALLKGAQ